MYNRDTSSPVFCHWVFWMLSSDTHDPHDPQLDHVELTVPFISGFMAPRMFLVAWSVCCLQILLATVLLSPCNQLWRAPSGTSTPAADCYQQSRDWCVVTCQSWWQYARYHLVLPGWNVGRNVKQSSSAFHWVSGEKHLDDYILLAGLSARMEICPWECSHTYLLRTRDLDLVGLKLALQAWLISSEPHLLVEPSFSLSTGCWLSQFLSEKGCVVLSRACGAWRSRALLGSSRVVLAPPQYHQVL